MSEFLTQVNSDMGAVITHVRERLVQVVNGTGGAGAGTIWTEDGLIITNHHVVGRRFGRRGLRGGSDKIQVILSDGSKFNAKVIAHAENHDLAALRIDAPNIANLPVIAAGDSKALKAGQWVMAIGHPWGVTGAVTSGMVVGTPGEAFPGMPIEGDDWVVAALHMRPGHSGGALVDEAGRLVGVNMMINGPDVGVAIPSNVVKQFVKLVLEQENQPQEDRDARARAAADYSRRGGRDGRGGRTPEYV